MSGVYTYEDRVTAGVAAAVAAGSTTAISFGRPVNIRRIVLVMTAAQTGAGAAATFGVRNVDDSTSVTKGSFTIPVSAVNSVLEADVAGVYTAPQTSDGNGISQPATVTTGRVVGRQVSTPGEVQVNPGQEFWVTIAAGGAGGTALLFVEYSEFGNNPTRYNATDMAVTLV